MVYRNQNIYLIPILYLDYRNLAKSFVFMFYTNLHFESRKCLIYFVEN